MCETNEYKNYLHLLDESNYYKILGVKNFSSLEDITKEYDFLVQKLHPDKYPHVNAIEKSKISEIFRKVRYSYNELRDVETKKKYDKDLLVEITNKDKSISLNTDNKTDNKTDIKQNSKDFINTEIKPESSTEDKTETKTSATSSNYVDPRIKGGFTFSKLEPIDIERLEKERKTNEIESAKIKLNVAKDFIQNSQYDKAVDILVELTEKFGSVAEYHSYLGLAMQGKGWNGYAQAEFKVALHFDPNDKISLENYKGNLKDMTSDNKEKRNQTIIDKLKSFFKK